MIDVAADKNLVIDTATLSENLGIPVFSTQANAKKGIIELKVAMSRATLAASPWQSPLPSKLETALLRHIPSLNEVDEDNRRPQEWEAFYLLGEHDPAHSGLSETERTRFRDARNKLETDVPGWEETLVATRYDAIHQLCEKSIRHDTATPATSLTDRLDSILLHRIWGWVSLVGIMATLFSLIFVYAGVPMDFVDGVFSSLAGWIQSAMPPGDLRDLLTDGVIAGVGGVLIFLPQILILFFFIGLMEDTGYMARVAFIMDRLMSKVGLNGKSFIPLLSSYACAIPGIMAARTIESPKDRLITILVAPFASCSARLPVYLIMIATIIPEEQVSAFTKVAFMIGLYALGTFGAFFFAWVFNRFLLRGESSLMILELPSYKAPSLKAVPPPHVGALPHLHSPCRHHHPRHLHPPLVPLQLPED